jgi:hypothetical protein
MSKVFIPGKSSPRGGRRGCLCEDNTYNIRCCDGSLRAQGIGNISRTTFYLLQENGYYLEQENNAKIIL